MGSVAGFLPYALGWLAGVAVRFARWLAAAVAAGWHDGVGDADWEAARRRGPWRFR